MQQRAIHRRDLLTEQLQTALNSRILIEQAKGIVAERLQIRVDEAFTVLRGAARRQNRKLSLLAQAVINGSEPVAPATFASRDG